jgi:hypothetical protein
MRALWGRGESARRVSRKDAKLAKVFLGGVARVGDLTETRRHRDLLASGEHEMAEWHGKGIGRARAQRSGARNRNRCARCGALGIARGCLTRSCEGREGFVGEWRAGVATE